MALVLDCSVTMAWFFKDEATAYTERVLDAVTEAEGHVPQHWPLEVANAIAMGERRKRVAPEQAEVWLEDLRPLLIRVDEHTQEAALRTTLKLARETGLTAYDAAYLELASRLNLPLATLDKQLAKAARKCDVKLFKP